MNAFEYLIAQFGSSSKRRISKAMVLDLADISGLDWTIQSQFSWRSGLVRNSSERDKRARKAGLFIAVRAFKTNVPGKGVWVEVMPFVSQEDAEASVSKLFATARRNPKSEVTTIEIKVIDDLEVPGVRNTFVQEASTTGEIGNGAERSIAGSVDNIAFIVSCYYPGNEWPWGEVNSLATLQAEKIRTKIRSESSPS
jgi:hypothetical protein